jgi:hypothetical protein
LETLPGRADCHDLGLGCRVVPLGDGVASRSDNCSIEYDDASNGRARGIVPAFFGDRKRLKHESLIDFGYDLTFLLLNE